MKRSQQKRVTLDAKIVRYMRVSRGISQREASRKCSLSEAAIGHYEHGRMEVSAIRLAQFLKAYGYTMEEFEEYKSGKPIPVVSVKDECVNLLNRIDDQKLRAVYGVLTSFVA